jgi:hypothetical protein
MAGFNVTTEVQSYGQHRPYLIANQQLTINAARAELVAEVAVFPGFCTSVQIRSAQLRHTHFPKGLDEADRVFR